ncbi:hypothetical protein ACRAWB_03395 [Leifsonia poae]|uniref:hypothetical protein n=1 Tax=Leifsonia poae TaxID=110933 RepID=UPI003D68F4CA
MVYALDPRIPRVWRTPDSIQFGVEAPVLVLEGVSPAEERMLAAMATGVTAEGLRVVAERARAEPGEAEALLERVQAVLVRAGRRAGAPVRARRVLVDGGGETAAVLRRMLSGVGVEVGVGPPWPRWADGADAVGAVSAVDAVVIVASYAVEPQRHARWLRRDVPHLPIVYGDGGVTVGPLVRPGRGPCLRCVDLHRTDADPAWPAMATQLHTRDPVGETAVAAGAAAARAAAVLLAEFGAAEFGGKGVPSAGRGAGAELGGRTKTARLAAEAESRAAALSARLAPGAVEWVSRAWEPHPECGCLGLPP